MERTCKPGITDSVLAAENLTKQRFVDFDGKHTKAGEKALGVCDENIEQNQYAPVVLNGILLVETGGTVTAGDQITSDGQGRAVLIGANQEINGYAIDESQGSGEVIRIARGI